MISKKEEEEMRLEKSVQNKTIPDPLTPEQEKAMRQTRAEYLVNQQMGTAFSGSFEAAFRAGVASCQKATSKFPRPGLSRDEQNAMEREMQRGSSEAWRHGVKRGFRAAKGFYEDKASPTGSSPAGTPEVSEEVEEGAGSVETRCARLLGLGVSFDGKPLDPTKVTLTYTQGAAPAAAEEYEGLRLVAVEVQEERDQAEGLLKEARDAISAAAPSPSPSGDVGGLREGEPTADDEGRVQMYNLAGEYPDLPTRLLAWPDFCRQTERAVRAENALDDMRIGAEKAEQRVQELEIAVETSEAQNLHNFRESSRKGRELFLAERERDKLREALEPLLTELARCHALESCAPCRGRILEAKALLSDSEGESG